VALKSFIGSRARVRTFQCDGARVLHKAAVDLGICSATSPPYLYHSNSVVERALRHVEEGAKTVLLQAGLPSQW
jgi:hypothetical protein